MNGRRGAALVFFAAAMGLSGCSLPADPQSMAVTTQRFDRPFPSVFSRAMCVRAVDGGEETNPLWLSKVGNDAFRSALEISLDRAGLRATGSCSYPIDVHLLGLSQPIFGVDLTVTSHVRYQVYASGAQPFLSQTTDASFTATLADHGNGDERLRLANEGSIRRSILAFFDKLRDADPPRP